MVRFVIHRLIEIMQIRCCSIKCCEIFGGGGETARFFFRRRKVWVSQVAAPWAVGRHGSLPPCPPRAAGKPAPAALTVQREWTPQRLQNGKVMSEDEVVLPLINDSAITVLPRLRGPCGWAAERSSAAAGALVSC